MSYILLATCADRPGISAAVTGFLADCGGFIQDSQQYGDVDTGLFFLRIAFRAASGQSLALADLRAGFESVAAPFGMRWSISDAAERPRAIIAVSKFGHCLNDLLHRWRVGILPIDVAGIVPNHPDLRPLVEWHGLPYHHLPVSAESKAEQERAFMHVVETASADLVVLARYMQILSPQLSRALSDRCINIIIAFSPASRVPGRTGRPMIAG